MDGINLADDKYTVPIARGETLLGRIDLFAFQSALGRHIDSVVEEARTDATGRKAVCSAVFDSIGAVGVTLSDDELWAIGCRLVRRLEAEGKD